MRLLLAGQEYHVEPSQHTVDSVLSLVEETARTKGLCFCALRLDGEEIYDHFREFLMEKMDTVETVEAVLLTKEQLSRDMLQSALEYVGNALPCLNDLADQFYSSPTEEAWTGLGQLVEAVQWLERIANLAPDYASLFVFSSELQMLETALFQNDVVMIGDIIQYEIMPRFEQIKSALSTHV